MAICTIATARCAIGGVMRGVTQATAFSFQSVMTSAPAGGACATRTTSGMAHLKAIDIAILPGCEDRAHSRRSALLARTESVPTQKTPSADPDVDASRRSACALDRGELAQAQPLLEAM